MRFFKMVTAMFALAVATNGHAAGIDCRKVESKAEELICSDARLHQLDEELNGVFNSAISSERTKEEIVKDQINWIAKVRDRCNDSTCLELIYSERIKYLKLKNNENDQGFILSLSDQTPARELAQDAELILVSGYEPTDGSVDITVDRPNSNVILILSSYESVLWKVNAKPKTSIKAILVGGYNKQQVFSNAKAPAYARNIPYATEENNINFVKILSDLNMLFYTKHVDYFNGSYKIPTKISVININKSNSDRLSLDGPPVVLPQKNFSFNLLNSKSEPIEWTLTGTEVKFPQSYLFREVAISSDRKSVYKLKNSSFEIFDTTGKKLDTIKSDPKFPEFSWLTDLAYDTKRNIVSIISLGGEGYFYRFDPIKKSLLSAKSVDNFDASSITYDAKLDRYIAWGSSFRGGELIIFDAEGNIVSKRSIADKLDGYGRLYDKNNGPATGLKVLAHGNSVALVAIRGGNVTHIWNYDLLSDKASLTYRAEYSSPTGVGRSIESWQ